MIGCRSELIWDEWAQKICCISITTNEFEVYPMFYLVEGEIEP
jgi:hypothetical protein